jgi:hypothetical protein
MDRRVRQIVEGFERLLKLTETNFLAKVVSDQGETVTVKDLTDTEYLEVRKSATVGERGLIITPEENSWVIVSRLSNSNDLYISMVSKVASVELMGGENGGIIKVEQLVTKLNQLITEINALKSDYTAHIHPTPSGPSSAPTVPFTGTFSQFNKSDFENDKITH